LLPLPLLLLLPLPLGEGWGEGPQGHNIYIDTPIAYLYLSPSSCSSGEYATSGTCRLSITGFGLCRQWSSAAVH
jgi:hypothetical protein